MEKILFIIYLQEECELAANTVRSYRASLDQFFERFSEVNKYNLMQYKQQLIDEGKKPATVNLKITAMNKYCEFIRHPEYKVKKLKLVKTSFAENVITLEEYNHLLKCLMEDGNERGYWMVRFLAQTGARVSEFVRLPRSCLESGYCDMPSKGRIRRIYVPDKLIEESREYFEKQKPSEYLFPSATGKEFSMQSVRMNLERWGRKYGVRKNVMHPHSFRHLFAIQFLKKNKNIALLADLMGHADVSTTSIYLRLSRQEQARQLNDTIDW